MTTEREARAAETIPAPAEEGWVRRGMLGVFHGGVNVSQPTAETIALKGSRGTVTVSAGYYVEAYETTPVEEIYHHGVARCDRPVINPAPAAEETWRWVPYRGKWAIAEAGNVHDPDGLHADAMHDGRWRVFRFGEAPLASGQAKDIDSAKRVAEVAYRAYKTSTASAPAAPPAAQTSSPREASTTGALFCVRASLTDASFDAACDLIIEPFDIRPDGTIAGVVGPARTGAAMARGKSEQSVGTPRIFLDAVERRFGPIDIDLAATAENAKATRYITPEQNSLAAPWVFPEPTTAWLNPPFGDIRPWVKKAAQVRQLTRSRILVLVPASIGSRWFAEYVHKRALVLALQGRLTFDGHDAPYPKDLILAVYGAELTGFKLWYWRPRGES